MVVFFGVVGGNGGFGGDGVGADGYGGGGGCGGGGGGCRGGGSGSVIYPHLHYGREECPVIPPVHWKGVPWQRSSRTLKSLSNLEAFMVCFLQLRDFRI